MGRKPSGFVGAKGKAKGSASSSPHAGRLEPCRTCNREFKPGAAYENHSRKCRSDLGKSEWQDTEWARELRVGLTRPDPSHAAKEQAGVRLQASVAAMTARLAGLDASPDHETDGRRELGPGSDDEEHWSDYNNDFGGNADDDLGGHQEFTWDEDDTFGFGVDGAAAESAAGSAATDDESDSDDSEVVGEEDHHQGPRVMNPALVEYRIINGVRLECHLPASTLDHTGWKNTRPLPAPPAQPPVPPKSKSREKQNVADVEPDSPNGEGDTGIDGDGTNPWHPFQTWTDFKITKMLKDLGASGAKIDDFLGVLNDDRFKVEEMHIRSAKKMEACLAYGRSLARAPWRSEDIVIAKEDGMDAKFTIWSRSIKEIVQELLGRPEVAKHMNWVPRKYYQTDAEGQKQRVYHDFDSGDYFHELHSSVKVGDYIIFLHLYADASKIATFGGNKVWPVRLWVGNLPYEQRTDASLVGSSLVGYVPIIEAIAGKNARSQPWFRRARHELYQAALKIILRDLIEQPAHGYVITASDGEPSRFCHFCVGCISMDLEELFKAFLGRGTQANFPCVCCKVPKGRQKDITTFFEERSMVEARHVQAEYTRLAANRQKGAAEQLLKDHSTYHHISALSLLQQPNIHRAIGNDELHRDAAGNWGKHVVPLLILQAGEEGGRLLDLRIKMYPTFVGLRTFSDFTGKPWVDATYYRALHAVLLFIAPGTLGDHEHHLLKLIRYWAIMHQYDGLHIQTKQTLASMQVVVSRIELLMKRVAQLCRKSIDYPKFHNLGKVVARMKLLGVGKFTSTRVGEELHRDDHAFYKTSNKRDVTEQLVKQHESKAIMQLIEGKAQRLFLETHPPPLPRQKPRVVVGSDDKTEKRWSFSHFLEQQREEDAYNNFTLKIRTLLYDPAGALPNARPRMALMPPISDCTISTYHLLHIQYPRIDNWEDGHDLARCHEVFGEKKRPRYDSVMYNPQHIINSPHDPDDTDLSFGRLVSIFKLTGPDGVAHRPMALVQNFVVDGRDVATWSLVGEEVERINCSVIWVDSIVRACHTPPKPEDDMQRLTKKNALNPQHEKGAYYINEFIDRDMYFRLKYALNVDTGDLEEKYFELVASENDSFMEDSDEEDLEVLGLEGEEEEGINEGAEDF